MQIPGCRVMVFTGLAEPLLLRAVIQQRPAVVVMCQEPLEVLRQALTMAAVASCHTVLSPAVTEGLALARYLTTRGGALPDKASLATLSEKEAAREMLVSPRAVSAWRRRMAGAGCGTPLFSWCYNPGRSQ
ncbi:hypothetical protein [Enterobacter vonholyi]